LAEHYYLVNEHFVGQMHSQTKNIKRYLLIVGENDTSLETKKSEFDIHIWNNGNYL
jgi:hypothetical protein